MAELGQFYEEHSLTEIDLRWLFERLVFLSAYHTGPTILPSAQWSKNTFNPAFCQNFQVPEGPQPPLPVSEEMREEALRYAESCVFKTKRHDNQNRL